MAFDATPGGDPRGPWCKSCKQPITEGQERLHIEIHNEDVADMSGLYHRVCGRPIAALARVLNMNWGR